MLKINDINVAKNIIFCNSILSKAMGLRFKILKKNEAYIFTFKNPVVAMMDMFFVFYPIDVLFLDSDKKIIEIKKKFLPFSFYESKNKINYTVELSKGSIEKFKIKIGNVLSFS